MSEPTAQESMDQHLKEARAALEAVKAELQICRSALGIQLHEKIPEQTPQFGTILVDSYGSRRRIAPANDSELEIAGKLIEAEKALAAMTEERDRGLKYIRELELKEHKLQAEMDAVKGELKSIAFTYCGVNTDDPTDFQGELTTGMVYAFLEGRFESLTAELDAVRKERDALQRFKSWVHNYLDQHDVPHHPPGTHGAEGCRIGDRMDWLMSKLDTAQARKAELERAIQEAPHDVCCGGYITKALGVKPPLPCNCWKSRISPDQKPALKGGDAGMFTKAPPMKGAADVQSESRPALPDHGKAGEWLPIEISKPAPCIVVLGFSADWIDFDYNPAGIRECFMDDMEIWLSPKWNNYQDVYENDFEAPTHWQPLLAPPTTGAKQSDE